VCMNQLSKTWILSSAAELSGGYSILWWKAQFSAVFRSSCLSWFFSSDRFAGLGAGAYLDFRGRC